jgi:hypothetical protein
LLLGEARLLAESSKPRRQSFSLFAEAALSASSTSPADHAASLEVNLYR